MTFKDALSIFDHLLTHSPDDLTAGLEQLPDISLELKSEVSALITAHKKNAQQTLFSSIIAEQVDTLDSDKSLLSLNGEQIQHFKLTTLLGSGGMGVVYLAERCDGQLEQHVAIKIIAPSITLLTSKELAFKEAQYLARLNHPNIAKVYDVGTTESGLIYLIMEYIEGEPLQKFCKNISNKELLSLFIKICDAVNYSHQNRIIHGDLKPENILVDKLGEPKLVDFGVAHTLSEQSDATYSAYINGLSKDYASPEQIAGEPLTTQSDVYSLGKILEKTLKSNNDEIKAIIEHACKKQSKRYSTSSLLAQDIKNYMGKLPLSINQSLVYSGKKFIQRNPISSLATALFICVVLAFSTFLIYKNAQLSQEKQTTEHIAKFMIETFASGNPEVNSGQSILAKDLLWRNVETAERKFSTAPHILFEIKMTIADSLYGLGEYERARDVYSSSLSLVSPQEQQVHLVKLKIAKCYTALNDYKQAIDITAQLLNDKTLLPNERLTALWFNGKALDHNSQFELAEKRLTEALNLVKDPILKADILLDLAHNQQNQSLYKESVKTRKQSLELLMQHLPKTHHKIAYSQIELSAMLNNLTQYEEAINIGEQGLTSSIKIYGETHPYVAKSMQNIAITYSELKRFDKARELLKRSISVQKDIYKEPNQDSVVGFIHIGNLEYKAKNYSEAEQYYKHALLQAKSMDSINPYLIIAIKNGLARIYIENKRFELARNQFDNLITMTEEHFGADHARTGLIIRNALPAYIALNEVDIAKEKAKRAIQILSKNYGESHQYVQKIKTMISDL
ncbi:serine/threonine-protein kinase [Pseudoalteromonas piscicida]|uniref:serine/threonine-protein kinase n=1 Tax=Pseudoalteromonas piscicida TaxID=43662 RepID=UPI0030A8870C